MASRSVRQVFFNLLQIAWRGAVPGKAGLLQLMVMRLCEGTNHKKNQNAESFLKPCQTPELVGRSLLAQSQRGTWECSRQTP